MSEKINNKSGSYREILKIAVPLILCNSAATIQFFVDRVMLSHYSDTALAASFPAGMTALTLMAFFFGVSGYVNTFVAQYLGAGQKEKIGSSIWQGIYFSIITGTLLTAIMIPLAPRLFNLIGHQAPLPQMETNYFRIVMIGAMPSLVFCAISCFYSGLGLTMPLVYVNIITTIINIFANYLLIFGNWGFPEMGINGAAIGTVIGEIIGLIVLIIIVFSRSHSHTFGLWSGRAFNADIFKRLIKYGMPAGVQFMIDMLGFNLFILLIGRLGKTELAATNIAFNINLFAFMPMIGFAIATTTLVGQYLGRNDPATAALAVRRCFKMTMIYMTSIAVTYIAFPSLYINLYGSEKDIAQYEEIRKIASVLLRFVAVYSIFDTLNLIYNSALRGAGDTFFIMVVIGIMSLLLVVIPTYITTVIYRTNLYIPWAFFTAYIALLGITFYLRFRHGKWESMRVIDMN